jgi:hypothetical protein
VKCPHNYSRSNICPNCLQPRNEAILFEYWQGRSYKDIGKDYGQTGMELNTTVALLQGNFNSSSR